MIDSSRPAAAALRLQCEGATALSDPLKALGASNDFSQQWERWQRGLVADAVEAGATWEQIGEALGTSRQAAWARFRSTAEAVRGGIRTKEQLVEARRELHDQIKTLLGRRKERDKEWRKERAAALEQVALVDRRRAEDRAALFEEIRQLMQRIKALRVTHV